jgi:prepilin-type N-terminal cleavage/methylation domain-containing protein
MARQLTAGRSGFTLIEILAVLAIMLLVMGLSLFAFMDFGRGARIKGAVLEFRAALSQARQDAVTFRRRTTLSYGSRNSRGYYVISNAVDGVVGVTNYFKEGLWLTNQLPSIRVRAFQFKLDGSCELDLDRSGSMTGEWEAPNFFRHVLLFERDRGALGLSATVRVYQLTGSARKVPE